MAPFRTKFPRIMSDGSNSQFPMPLQPVREQWCGRVRKMAHFIPKVFSDITGMAEEKIVVSTRLVIIRGRSRPLTLGEIR